MNSFENRFLQYSFLWNIIEQALQLELSKINFEFPIRS